jgi:uncharacterized protein DUF4058
MPSPFPGMDPYIEAHGDWLDFHGAFMTYCRDLLNASLPEGYAASLDTRLKLVHAEDDVVEGRMRPDLGIHRHPEASAFPSDEGAIATLEPQTLTLPVHFDEIRESAVQIVRYPERRLVTHLELLSPTNKRNPDRGEYLAKRVALIHQQKVNVVEIDLLLVGERLETVEPLPRGDYYAFVSRPNRLPAVDVYAWSVRRALPTIPIPLLPPDADVPLDIAPLVAQVYDRGRYRQLLGYQRPLDLPLSDADRAWALEIAGAAR